MGEHVTEYVVGSCWQPCDPDCELGPVHCVDDHNPTHKRDFLLHDAPCVARREREAAERALRDAADHFDRYDEVTIGQSDIGSNQIPVPPADRLRARAAALASGRGAAEEGAEG